MILNNFIDVGLNYTTSEVFWSPMRLTLCIEGLDLKSEDLEINKRGPRSDANEAAVDGFAKGLNVKKRDLILENTSYQKSEEANFNIGWDMKITIISMNVTFMARKVIVQSDYRDMRQTL